MEVVGYTTAASGFPYTWIPVDGNPDPRAGTSQNAGSMHSMGHVVTTVGTLRLQWSGQLPTVPCYVAITYDASTGHHYAGGMGDPCPVVVDPTPDVIWDYGWERWWGDFISLTVAVYRDSGGVLGLVVPPPAPVLLPPGMFAMDSAVVGPGPPPAPAAVPHPYSVLVDHRIAPDQTWDIPIEGNARYFTVSLEAFGNDSMDLPIVTFRGGVPWTPSWPYEQPAVQAGQPNIASVRMH